MWAVAAVSVAGSLGLSPFRYDDDDDDEDDNDINFAAFFINCSFTCLFFVFLNALFPLCAFFTFSLLLFYVVAAAAAAGAPATVVLGVVVAVALFVAVVVAVVLAVGATAAASTAVGAPGYSPFRNLVL